MGLAPNKDALLHVLCRKANMTYESFVTITQSVYMLQYMDKEKVGTRGGGGGTGSKCYGLGNEEVLWPGD